MIADTKQLSLTDETFLQGLHYLYEHDPDLADLAQLCSQPDPPSKWAREPGFASLIYIILEQQVSLASARAAFERLQKTILPFTPKRFLDLNDATLRAIGFSRQKTAYGRHLAGAIVGGYLDLDGLELLDDMTARSELTRIKGVGPWTANIYLLTALRRPDIWPKEDLALAVATQAIKRLPARPTPYELDILGADWKPWRSVVARLLWHYYLGKGSARGAKTENRSRKS